MTAAALASQRVIDQARLARRLTGATAAPPYNRQRDRQSVRDLHPSHTSTLARTHHALAMAWGYWSATTVSDRGRSPRRNQTPVSTVASIPNVEERPAVSQYSNVNSNNNTVPPPLEFDVPATFSRRPSLDLGHGPQGALAVVMCGAHGPQIARQGPGGTLSAGNTLTRIGSRHTATAVVDYAVPHHFHHHGGYIEYHDHHLSPSDDDDSEPGYATGTNAG